MSYEQVEADVMRWLSDRKITQNQRPEIAVLKFISEAGELADAEAKGDTTEQIDAVGDILVTLISYCAIKNYDLVGCLNAAYQVIRYRTGTMLPNGLFVKDDHKFTPEQHLSDLDSSK